MTPIWEYFEDLEEIVYVADAETYELVYLNKCGRDAFLIKNREEYRGKKCYEVLQGYSGPCPFCTNDRLKMGKFLKWPYRNPLTRRYYSIQDTLLEYEGRQYRMEFARDAEEGWDKEVNLGAAALRHYENLVNECLLIAHSSADQDVALKKMLAYLGPHIHCSALNVYELRAEEWVVNTYSWARSGGSPDPKLISISFGKPLIQWYEVFAHNQPLILTNTTEFCKKYPEMHAIIPPESVERAILLPLLSNDKAIGFWQVDNPEKSHLGLVADLCQLLSHFIVSIIRQRDLVKNLAEISFHDQLTGALNRYALNTYMAKTHLEQNTGLIYCDLNGLKRTNDQYGHSSGDRLLIQAYHILGSVFISDQIFRMGGDEFLVVCEQIDKGQLDERVERLRRMAVGAGCGMSIGSAWAGAGDTQFSTLLDRADEQMYQEKRLYHLHLDSAGRNEGGETQEDALQCSQSSAAVQRFIQDYYFDVDSFIRSQTTGRSNYYIYFGDMRKNLYYISDNLKEDFGFSGNLVTDFVSRLEQRIYGPDQAMHVEETQRMVREKREIHSIRYRIYDKNGELGWLHCRGIMKWDEEKREPLFFSGSMVSLKNELEVDPITGLLKLNLALKRVEELNNLGVSMMLMCVTFRDFADINRVYGRDIGDELLKEIGGQIERDLGSQFSCYRMDGARFLLLSQTVLEPGEPAGHLQDIVKGAFRRFTIHMVSPCAIGVVHGREEKVSAQMLIDNAIGTARTAKAFPGLSYLETAPHSGRVFREQTNFNIALNACVERGFQGFRTMIQPQVEVKSGRIFGGEVLLRWNNGGEEISPGKFIPVLEQTGLIVPVGKWVLDQTIQRGGRVVKRWPNFEISVNVSYLQVVDRNFFPFLEETLRRHHMPPQNLFIELTETHFDEMPDHLQQFVQQCKQIGVRFALDDFGSAYSGLQMLLRYPADLIKLDRTLMQEVTSSKEKQRFIKSLVYACHQFKRRVCMEGVETREELDVIRKTDCDFIQGFYFYKPMSWDDLEHTLEQKAEGPGFKRKEKEVTHS